MQRLSAVLVCVLDPQGLIESQVRCLRRLVGGPFVGKALLQGVLCISVAA